MDLKVPIQIADELEDEVIEATGTLNLASGEIDGVTYTDYDVDARGLPAEHKHYDFTTGTLTNGRQDVEFSIVVDVLQRKYSVTPSELLEVKGRAAKLFSGQTDGQPTVTPIKGVKPARPKG